MEKQIAKEKKWKLPTFGPRLSIAVNVLLVLGTLAGCFFILEYVFSFGKYSSTASYFLSLPWKYYFLNITTLGILWSAFLILCNRVWLASILLSAASGIIAIINHFVILFHGMPLSFLLLRNIGTAMNVISGYSFEINTLVVRLIIITVLLVMLGLAVRAVTRLPELSLRKIIIRDVLLAVLCAGVFHFSYLGSNPLKPAKTFGWNWKDGYAKYGYVACTVESLMQSTRLVNMPDTYSQGAIDSIEISNAAPQAGTTPDVLLILNETFYDLSEITDPQTDVDYMAPLSEIEGLIRGYAITPGAGGGTNNSEYELLTSNSMFLMPGVTPFNSLSLTGAKSVVSHLKDLGYHTIASHCAPAVNYSRSVGYPALGFDLAYFDNDYVDEQRFHNRPTTDESVYRNVIRWYEEAPENQPRFQYVLTYQNHGGYEYNEPEHDTVHAKTDYGETTELVNEFLTSIQLSCESFRDLTEYFAAVDRPVIICMVGDHGPTFASSIADSTYTEDEKNMLLRKVPLLFWANYPLEDIQIGTMSVNYVVPTLLELADIRLSPYYSFLQQAKEQVPIITSYGSYYDADYNHYTSTPGDGSDLQNVVDTYLNLAYHNIKSTQNRELFTPYP